MKLIALSAAALLPLAAIRAEETQDPYLWLEDVDGAKAQDWVHAQDALTQKELEAQPDFKPINERLLSIYDSHDKIPYVAKHGAFYYNFWRDENHSHGLWR